MPASHSARSWTKAWGVPNYPGKSHDLKNCKASPLKIKNINILDNDECVYSVLVVCSVLKKVLKYFYNSDVTLACEDVSSTTHKLILCTEVHFVF